MKRPSFVETSWILNPHVLSSEIKIPKEQMFAGKFHKKIILETCSSGIVKSSSFHHSCLPCASLCCGCGYYLCSNCSSNGDGRRRRLPSDHRDLGAKLRPKDLVNFVTPDFGWMLTPKSCHRISFRSRHHNRETGAEKKEPPKTGAIGILAEKILPTFNLKTEILH